MLVDNVINYIQGKNIFTYIYLMVFMKLKFLLLSIPVSLISLLTSNNIAKAAYFNPLTGYSEADLLKEIDRGSFIEEFNAASYIGDNGMAAYELELNNIVPPATVDPTSSSQKQFLWQNGEEVNFKLSFDGEILQYQVGEEVLTAIDVNEAGFDINGMILSARSTENSQTKLSNLVFDDGSISTINLMSQDGETDFLKITGIDNTFILSGTQVFSWTGARPENFDLAYQIRVGTFQEVNSDKYKSNQASLLVAEEIPEPKTISLFSLFLVGLIFKKARS